MKIEEQILQMVFDTSPDAIVMVDEHGLMRSFNRMAEALFGYAAGDVLGQNVKMLMPKYFAEHHDGYMERYMRTGEKRIIGIGRIVTGQRKDGSTFPLELSIGEARAPGRRIFAGFIRDLTGRQQVERRVHELQEELIHASRLASLGEISSMIAHEANQPLSAAGTYLEVARALLESAGDDERSRGMKALDQAGAQIRRVGDTVRRIREFARKKTPEFEAEDLNRMIEEANGIASVGARGRGIRTIFDFCPERPLVRADRIQIQQVVMNLVRNSIDAMTGQARRELTLKSRLTEDGNAEVAVADTGTGIGADAVKHLFTPFMTTKKDGTGLGLAICKSIIEAHGGKLWYEVNPEGGAVFKFTLPVHKAAARRDA